MTIRPLAVLASLALTHVVAADFEIIGPSVQMVDLSYDGSAIACRVADPDDPCNAVTLRWRDGVGFETLATPPVCLNAYDMSPDGAYIVGLYNSIVPGTAVLWDDQGNVTELPIGGADHVTTIGGVTNDGLVVGTLQFGLGFESVVPAVQWQLGGGHEVIGPCAWLSGVSGDGGLKIGTKVGTGKCQEREIPGRPTVFHAGGESMLDIDGAMSGPGVVATDGSFARCNFAQSTGPKTAVWTPADGWEVTDVADDPWVTSISDDGRVATLAGGTGNNVEISIDGEVMNFNDYLVAQGVDLPPGWLIWQASPKVSADGRVIAGIATSDDFDRSLFRYVIPDVDSDGDGLLDSWETVGVPYTDSNGDEQHYVLDIDGDGQSDADPMRKDLFVEVDVMSEYSGDLDIETAIGLVVTAFANSGVANPDGSTGIDLHVAIDDGDLPTQPSWGPGWPAEFDLMRSSYFGTSDEFGDSELLGAKAKAYRYCIFCDDGDGWAGIARTDIPTADFIVAYGGAQGSSLPTPLVDRVAGVFMHELGHALGLSHGGNEEHSRFKPNYPSVMSYIRHAPLQSGSVSWVLDYSYGLMPSINQSDLTETAGLLAPPNVPVPWTYLARTPSTFPDQCGGITLPLPATVDFVAVPWNVPFDLDGDGAIEEQGAGLLTFAGTDHSFLHELDQNGDPVINCTMLHDHDDWSNLSYAVPPSVVGPGQPDPPDELSWEELELLAEILPEICDGDTNGDEMVNTDDLLNVLGGWGGTGYHPADVTFDGAIDVADVLLILGNWGPCD